MNRAVDACPRHLELVTAAFGESPSDDELERYAALVPTCPDCRRLLAIRIGVHPGRLEVPSLPRDELAGMQALARALGPAAPARSALGLFRSRGALVAAGLLIGVAVAASLGGTSRWTGEPAAPLDAPSAIVSVAPAPEAPAQAEPVESARAAPPAPAPARPRPSRPDTRVALADDWDPPPYQDLRGGTSKSVGGNSIELQVQRAGRSPSLDRGAQAFRIGDRVRFSVFASADAEISVCVEGPERGIIWRGAVGDNRTPLPSDFELDQSGGYTFLVARGVNGCADPAHKVWVEVP